MLRIPNKAQRFGLKMNDLRKVEVFREQKWTEVRLENIKKGELFRMFEFLEMIPVLNNSGKHDLVAVSEPYIGPNGPNKENVWTVDCDD